MTDNQKIAYEWAKSHDYPSIAARYARELAGLVDDLQGAYDAMVRDLTARTRQVRQLQGEISALRQQETVAKCNGLNEPLTLDELRQMDGEPVFVVTDRLKEWCLVHSHNSDDVIGGGIIMTRRTAEKRTYQYACYGKTWLAYRQKKEV